MLAAEKRRGCGRFSKGVEQEGCSGAFLCAWCKVTGDVVIVAGTVWLVLFSGGGFEEFHVNWEKLSDFPTYTKHRPSESELEVAVEILHQ